MLVISRSVTSAIRIADNITVKVLKIGQKRVTLGVDAPPEVSVRRDEAAEQRQAAEQQPAPLDLRVLVVEDTPVHAMLIERVLTRRGVRNIVRTSNGEDALRLLALASENKALRPDLVLLDLQLPGVSGQQVLETIKSDPHLRAIPVVILSSSDADSDVARCMTAGANAFVSKSEHYERFRESILRITDFWSQARSVN